MFHRKCANTCEPSFGPSHRNDLASTDREREWEKDSTIDLSRLFPWSGAREETEEMKQMMSH